MNIFITGIENTSGKTVISAGLAAVMQSFGYSTGVYKPIQTGAIDKGKYLISPDLALIKLVDPYITTHCTYMFKTNTFPQIAAELEKKEIDIENILNDYHKLDKKTDTLIVESSGGLMSPINNNLFNYNIPLLLNIPVVFVVSPSLDNLNHYLNELNSARTLGLDVIGVIINKFPVYSENIDVKAFPSLVEKYGKVKVLGLIRNFKGKSVQANILINEILNGIDIQDVFNIKIPKLNGF